MKRLPSPSSFQTQNWSKNSSISGITRLTPIRRTRMSVDLQTENEALRKENEELKKEIQQLKTTLEKFKESSRFQVAQLIIIQTVVEAAEGLQRFPKGATEDYGR